MPEQPEGQNPPNAQPKPQAGGAAAPAQPQVPQQALQALVAAAGIAKAHGRTDLIERLERSRRRMADPSIRVLVVGEFKQGKSSLVNGLVGANVCPVDDDVATSVVTAVRYAEQPYAAVTLAPAEGQEQAPAAETIPLDQLASYVSEAGNPGNQRHVQSAEVGIPRKLLLGGLVLVDTPGVGGLGSAHGATTIGALPTADAVLLVTGAAQELSGPELDFLKTAIELCPNVAIVLTKFDFYPEWRRMIQLDKEHLQRAGVTADVLPVSSTLRQQALAAESKELNDESGYPKLLEYLQRFIVGNAQRLALRAAVNDALSVLGQVMAPFASERAILQDPESAKDLLARLQSAKEEAERLRGQAARWQTTLSDGIGDLGADVDFDFRDRTRLILRDADDSIERSDPGEMWEEFQSWMYRRMAAEVAENYALLTRRAEELADRVAEHFAGVEKDIDLSLAVAAPAVEELTVDTELRRKDQSVAARGMLALRSSYGSVSMFGMLGSTLGLATFNPATVLIGLMTGRKALHDEKTRQIEMRRQQAKQAVRRFSDEVSFKVGKDSKDTLRRLQREMRDAFQARAEELQRSTQEALQAAQGAAQSDQAERQKRLQQIQAEMQKVEVVRMKIAQLAPEIGRAHGVGAPPG